MRRGTALTQEHTGDISDMKNEIAAIKKSLGNVEELPGTVDRIDRQLMGLIQWQNEVVTAALQQAKAVEKSVQLLQRDVGNMTTWKPKIEEKLHGVLQVSAFDMWPEKEYATVKNLATAALPRSAFDKYVSDMEGIEISQKSGDATMGRGGYVGKLSDHGANREDEDDCASPRQAAKRRHGSSSGSSTPPTPQSPQPTSESAPPATPPGSSTPGADAFTATCDKPEDGIHRSRTTRGKAAAPRSLEFRKELARTEHNQWSEHVVKLILDDWNGARMERLEGWGKEHCSVEMCAAIRQPKR